MRNLTIAAAVTAVITLALLLALPVQASPGARAARLSLPAPYGKVEPAACRGQPGPYCPPGRHRVCGPYGHHCWCAPC